MDAKGWLATYQTKMPPVLCASCGGKFVARRGAVTCSPRCRTAHHRKRKRSSDGVLQLISSEEASEILHGKHYLGGVEFNPRFCIATAERDAVAVFSHPISHHFKMKLRDPLELARLWKSDHSTMPLSQFLGRSLRWIRKLAPKADCVFSYADPSRKNKKTGKRHTGTIYQATNFTYLGPSRVTDYWRKPSGELVSSPVCYRVLKTKSRERIKKLRPTWKLIRGKPKHLYVFGLRRTPDEVLTLIRGRYKGRQDYPR
jgi:hypothetical protein